MLRRPDRSKSGKFKNQPCQRHLRRAGKPPRKNRIMADRDKIPQSARDYTQYQYRKNPIRPSPQVSTYAGRNLLNPVAMDTVSAQNNERQYRRMRFRERLEYAPKQTRQAHQDRERRLRASRRIGPRYRVSTDDPDGKKPPERIEALAALSDRIQSFCTGIFMRPIFLERRFLV